MSNWFRRFSNTAKAAVSLTLVLSFVAACAEGPTTAPKSTDGAVALSNRMNIDVTYPYSIFPADQNAQTVCNAIGAGYIALRPANNGAGSFTFVTNGGTAGITFNTDATGVYWSTNFLWDFVAVHGGDANLVYPYSASGFGLAPSDTNWAGPSGDEKMVITQKGFSNITFCVGPASMKLDASAKASGKYDRRYGWDIEKMTSNAAGDDGPVEQTVNGTKIGDEFTLWYKVKVTRDTGTKENFRVSGSVTVTNNTYAPASGVAVALLVDGNATACTDLSTTINGGGGSSTCTFANVSVSNESPTISASVTVNSPHYAPASLAPVASFTQDQVFNGSVSGFDKFMDTAENPLGTNPITSSTNFTYSRKYTATKCGDSEVLNTARLDFEVDSTASALYTVLLPADCDKIVEPPDSIDVYVGAGTAYRLGTDAFCGDKTLKSNNWGWMSFLAPGTTNADLMLGAAQCKGGTKVGTVTISYTGTSATVTYNLEAPYALTEAHVYAAGSRQKTTSPGQYTSNSGSLANVSSYSVTINGLPSTGTWFSAHAAVSKLVRIPAPTP